MKTAPMGEILRVFLKDWLHKALVSSKQIPSPELFLSLGSWKLEDSKCHSCLQQEQVRQSRELQATQPHPWLCGIKADRQNPPGKAFHTPEGQGDWE